LYPLYRKLGGLQGRFGQMRKISPPTGIRSPDRPARSLSLYRQRYPAHDHVMENYTVWTQKHSLISSSYTIKIYWNIVINMGLQIVHWHLAVRTFLNEHLPNRWIGRAGHNDQVFCKWPPEVTAPDRLWLFLLGILEGQSLCTSTTHKRGWAAGTHYCSCQVSHAGCAAQSLVRARLSHRCLPSYKMGAHWVCVWYHMKRYEFVQL